MPTLHLPSDVPLDDVAAVEQFAQSASNPDMRDLLLSIANLLRDGVEVVTLNGVDTHALTPTEVARRLGMSRTHLYKLLDRGEIPFHRVGRDRRIAIEDVVAFEARRQCEKRMLAEAFAHRDQTHAAAVDAIADLL
ncbi:MAG: helix-turn-helix domain-containing protein [Actinobacteria bacterium]|nr:helix-turn-helix domain-containing protein [Actinomycetota bacterium]